MNTVILHWFKPFHRVIALRLVFTVLYYEM
jgi:hypothetical protein